MYVFDDAWEIRDRFGSNFPTTHASFKIMHWSWDAAEN